MSTKKFGFNAKNVKLFTVLGLSFLSFDSFSQDYFKQVEKDAKGSVKFAVIDQSKLSSDANPSMLRKALNMRTDDDLKLLQTETDDQGFTHNKHQQFYKGVKVEYGTYITHTKNGILNVINGDFKQVGTINTTPALDEKAALQAAMNYVGAKSYMWQLPEEEAWLKESNNDNHATFLPKGELVICEDFTKEDGSHVLAYKFDVYAKQPVSRAYIYVNAATGEIVHTNAIIKHVNATGTAATRYSGSRTITTDQVTTTSFRLRETARGLGIETYNMKKGTNYASAVDFTDADNNWTSTEFNNTNKDNAALDAHWGAAVTYDYWKNVHGRNSYDNAGAKIKSYVHFDLNYDNAYWNGSVMTYGDGSGTGGFNALTALDVCGHEIGHAICEKTANLAYQKNLAL
jgi:Zn-dependent metalloprotease